MISFDSMKTELKARLGNRTDLDARMVRWINYAFFEILMNPRFLFFEIDAIAQFDTVATQKNYTIADFASDFWFTLDIRDMTNQRRLLRTHWSYLDKVVDTTGQPSRYFRFGGDIVIEPIPDAIYTMQIRYRRRPADLNTGSLFEGLGTEWEEKVVTLAAVKAFEALKLTEQAAGQRQLYEAMLSTMSDVPGLEDFDSETGIMVSLVPRL